MDEAVRKALMSECARLGKIMALPLDQQEAYAKGIAKLETRIDELRTASGMDFDTFADKLTSILRQVSPMTALSDAGRLETLMGRADEAWIAGDGYALQKAFDSLEKHIEEAASG